MAFVTQHTRIGSTQMEVTVMKSKLETKSCVNTVDTSLNTLHRNQYLPEINHYQPDKGMTMIQWF